MDESPFLRDIWYFALPSGQLRPGQMLRRMLLGEPVLFARDSDGVAFALRDICPHRAIPLSYGKFDGREVECCYHGWRFDRGGACTHIPALTGRESVSQERIRVRSYLLHEAQGCIWIFMPEGRQPLEPPPPPRLPDLADDARPLLVETMVFPCFIDHAVVGLMDPAHGPFVHKSWWWRSEKSIHEKAKAFGPAPFGFAMLRHQPSKNSFAHNILGGRPETEIAFRLPGFRVEHIRTGQNRVINLTCVTPVGPEETVIVHFIYTTLRWARPLRPLIRRFVRRFLWQDKRVVTLQQEGLRFEQNLLLIRDSDTQAKWYYQLKNEWNRAKAESREFKNPVRATTLQWRS